MDVSGGDKETPEIQERNNNNNNNKSSNSGSTSETGTTMISPTNPSSGSTSSGSAKSSPKPTAAGKGNNNGDEAASTTNTTTEAVVVPSSPTDNETSEGQADNSDGGGKMKEGQEGSEEGDASVSGTGNSTSNSSESDEVLIRRRVFVGNISRNATVEKLTQLLAQFGPAEVNIIMDRENSVTKGYAFATFQTEEQAQACINTASLSCDGRELNLRHAKRRPPSSKQTQNNSHGGHQNQKFQNRYKGRPRHGGRGQMMYAEGTYGPGAYYSMDGSYQPRYLYNGEMDASGGGSGASGTDATGGGGYVLYSPAGGQWLVSGAPPTTGTGGAVSHQNNGMQATHTGSMDPRMYYPQAHQMQPQMMNQYYQPYYAANYAQPQQHQQMATDQQSEQHKQQGVPLGTDTTAHHQLVGPPTLSDGSSPLLNPLGEPTAMHNNGYAVPMMTAHTVLASPGLTTVPPGGTWAHMPTGAVYAQPQPQQQHHHHQQQQQQQQHQQQSGGQQPQQQQPQQQQGTTVAQAQAGMANMALDK